MIPHTTHAGRRAALFCILLLAALAAMPTPCPAAGQAADAMNSGTPWPAIDALGRVAPAGGEVAAPRPGHVVGIFYFLTLGGSGGPGPFNIAEILARDPGILKKPNSPLWGGAHGPYFWGEPLLGYYNTTDPWVLRRHAHLLADAGVDTLIFDTTNAVTYRNVYMKLCEVFSQVRKEGGRTPQLCFMVNTRAGATAREIYNDLYKPGLYKELWFEWQGKPLMICDPAEADPELRAFFTLRKAHWPFEQVNTKDAWHWEAAYPQHYGFSADPARPEQVNVSVAQNLRAADGKVTDMSRGDARGRSFHGGKLDRTPGAIQWGHNFKEQWQRALELDPPFVMITGWNEWTAGRWRRPYAPVVFVDQFNDEFSRDIEPVKGGIGDNYYYQMVEGIRRYKGAPALPAASAEATIKLDGGFEQWRGVAPEFADHLNETLARDFDGQGRLHYVEKSGRNDLAVMKVARDAKNVYFYARTREALTPATQNNWMWLMIDADRNLKTGWEGFDYIVNRTIEGGKTAWLEKNAGGWKWEKVAPVEWKMAGNELHLAIPRAALGMKEGAGKSELALDFKWADNLQHPGDAMDFYQSGDTAPEGRFRYRYVVK
jgi:hypothetical protein